MVVDITTKTLSSTLTVEMRADDTENIYFRRLKLDDETSRVKVISRDMAGMMIENADNIRSAFDNDDQEHYVASRRMIGYTRFARDAFDNLQLWIRPNTFAVNNNFNMTKNEFANFYLWKDLISNFLCLRSSNNSNGDDDDDQSTCASRISSLLCGAKNKATTSCCAEANLSTVTQYKTQNNILNGTTTENGDKSPESDISLPEINIYSRNKAEVNICGDSAANKRKHEDIQLNNEEEASTDTVTTAMPGAATRTTAAVGKEQPVVKKLKETPLNVSIYAYYGVILYYTCRD